MAHPPRSLADSEGVALSTDLDDPEAIPYFLWDEPMTLRELHERLRTASRPERLRLLAKILREARDTEVWKFTNPDEIAISWRDLAGQLGRRRPLLGLSPQRVAQSGAAWNRTVSIACNERSCRPSLPGKASSS